MTLVDVPLATELVRGALELEQTGTGLVPHRLPAWARAQADGQLAMSQSQPSGVRLVLRTTATVIELDTLPTKREYAGAPPRPDGVYDLVVDGRPSGSATVPGGRTLVVDYAAGSFDLRPGEPGTARFTDLPAGEKTVEIWLPHDETTELVALRADAPVAPAAAGARRTWVHHGSSISHGSNAATPTGTWPAVAARLAGVDLVNLGYGGSALLDPSVARVLRDTPADLVSLKIGINLVNADVMRLRAFTAAVHGYLDAVREGHPTIPLVVVSPIHCPIHEDTPGPSAMDPEALAQGRLVMRATGDPAAVAAGALTLTVIRAELARIVAERAAGDPHLSYLDGQELYGPADHDELPLPDRLHPDAATHRRMGERFAARVLTNG